MSDETIRAPKRTSARASRRVTTSRRAAPRIAASRRPRISSARVAPDIDEEQSSITPDGDSPVAEYYEMNRAELETHDAEMQGSVESYDPAPRHEEESGRPSGHSLPPPLAMFPTLEAERERHRSTWVWTFVAILIIAVVAISLFLILKYLVWKDQTGAKNVEVRLGDSVDVTVATDATGTFASSSNMVSGVASLPVEWGSGGTLSTSGSAAYEFVANGTSLGPSAFPDGIGTALSVVDAKNVSLSTKMSADGDKARVELSGTPQGAKTDAGVPVSFAVRVKVGPTFPTTGVKLKRVDSGTGIMVLTRP